MCGIAAGLVGNPEIAIDKLIHRGPDAQGISSLGSVWLAHTRLSILDLDSRSDQPFRRGEVSVTYNGELWNYREIRTELESLGETFTTEGDTEVVAAALDHWDEEALPRFEGMFTLAWTRDFETVKAARDRFGETPLHVGLDLPIVASEIRALMALGCRSWAWVEPGTIVTLGKPGARVWYRRPALAGTNDMAEAAVALRALVEIGVRERTISDVPVCALLSGGIDSSAITMLAAQRIPGLVAYTAVTDHRNKDLRFARIAAQACGVELIEVPVADPTADDLAEVVRIIEMPHKPQVEIGWPCLALAQRARSDGFKVIYSGEGSDELWASYGKSYFGIQRKGWYRFRRELFHGQHAKNFARCNKVFMAHGIECRLPFLSTGLVEYALSLPQVAVARGRHLKAVLSEAFVGELPVEILRRHKMAFQEGIDVKRAAGEAIADPTRFYREELRRYVTAGINGAKERGAPESASV